MKVPSFSESELEVVGEIPATPWRPAIAEFNYPVSPRDAILAMYERTPIWQPIGIESKIFTPRIFPDNVARGFVFENRPFDAEKEGGGKDMFGVEWVYDTLNMGSMVYPGKPMLEDFEDWRDAIVFPDVDSWDWEGSAAENNGTYLTPDTFNKWWIQTGFFERLISFMDFEGAALTLFDEDYRDDVKEIMNRFADLYIDIIDHVIKYFPDINGFYIHDDWGTSLDTFFSPELAKETIVPAMRKVTDHIHKNGLYAELHSCGCNKKQIENYIAAGWDAWIPQGSVNDTASYYEKYGDKLIFGLNPVPPFDPETTSEDEQRAIARDYADRFCKPGIPTMFDDVTGAMMLTPAFREELYKQSRINYSS